MKVLVVVTSILALVFGYSAYEAMKLQNKLDSNSFGTSDITIKQAPDVKFKDIKGNDVKISELTLKENVLVHFWATWCAPCEREFPELVEMIKSNRVINYTFVLVATNDQKKDVKKFLSKFGARDLPNTYILFDDYYEHKKYGAYKLPETYILHKSLKVKKKMPGTHNWMSEDILKTLQNL